MEPLNLEGEGLNTEKLLWIYERMFRIRAFEERVRREFAAGNLPGFVHLYVGEEATAVGVCAVLRPDDALTSTHRGHGHCIARGLDVGKMFAELMGKATGFCRGKAGSMHIADIDKGMLGANGIVGAGLPIATGAALTFKYKGTDRVCVCFFGDGAIDQGSFNESINLASIWKLPVIFVCENNGYAEMMPVSYHVAGRSIAERGAGYAIPVEAVDGTDVLEVYSAARRAAIRARRGEGPTLIESRCYRRYGHYEGDPQKYKTDEETKRYDELDPLRKFWSLLVSRGLATQDQLSGIENSVLEEIDTGWRFGLESPLPRPEEALEDVYVSYPMRG